MNSEHSRDTATATSKGPKPISCILRPPRSAHLFINSLQGSCTVLLGCCPHRPPRRTPPGHAQAGISKRIAAGSPSRSADGASPAAAPPTLSPRRRPRREARDSRPGPSRREGGPGGCRDRGRCACRSPAPDSGGGDTRDKPPAGAVRRSGNPASPAQRLTSSRRTSSKGMFASSAASQSSGRRNLRRVLPTRCFTSREHRARWPTGLPVAIPAQPHLGLEIVAVDFLLQQPVVEGVEIDAGNPPRGKRRVRRTAHLQPVPQFAGPAVGKDKLQFALEGDHREFQSAAMIRTAAGMSSFIGTPGSAWAHGSSAETGRTRQASDPPIRIVIRIVIQIRRCSSRTLGQNRKRRTR